MSFVLCCYRHVLAEMLMTRVVNIVSNLWDVYIGRAGQGLDGYFSNPFGGMTGKTHAARTAAIDLFTEYFLARVEKDAEFRRRVLALRGKTLGCFCKPKACHGDVIARWIDAQQEAK